jgi:hypothetical protein
MSLRPSKPAGQRDGAVGTAAFRAQLAQCTAAAHRWNLQEHSCDARKPASASDHTPARTDAGYADLEEAYELGRAPRWTWSNMVKEEDLRGRDDRVRRRLRDIPKEPDALECQICFAGLDEKTDNTGSFGREEIEVLQELTAERRQTDPNAPQACGHVFHRNCLANWIQEGRNTCPSCRERIPDSVIANLVPGGVPAPPPVIPDDDDEFDDPVGVDDYNGDDIVLQDTSIQDSRLILARLEEIFDNFDEGDERTEQEIIQAVDLTIDEALQTMNDRVYTEYVLYRDWGDILINRSRSLRLYALATWFEQRRRLAFEENDRIEGMFDALF